MHRREFCWATTEKLTRTQLSGIVSLQDLAEELVGEIHDEDDLIEAAIERLDDTKWQVPGRMRLDEVEDATGITLPAHDTYDTISGLVLHQLGRTAEVGDEVEFDGVTLLVTVVERNVLDTVVVTSRMGERQEAR